jgi:hypothetical protein
MRNPNADFLERTGSENLGARLWRLPPRSANTLHKHIRQEEFYFVLEGTGRLRVGEVGHERWFLLRHRNEVQKDVRAEDNEHESKQDTGDDGGGFHAATLNRTDDASIANAGGTNIPFCRFTSTRSMRRPGASYLRATKANRPMEIPRLANDCT